MFTFFKRKRELVSFFLGKHYVEENRSDYTAFGMVGVLFEMLPFLGFITPVTNVIGSALWARDIENFKDPLTQPRSGHGRSRSSQGKPWN